MARAPQIHITGTLQGATEAITKLSGLSRSWQKRIGRKGLRKSAQLGAKLSKPHVPVDTKLLRNSFGWRMTRQRSGAYTSAAVVGPRRRYKRSIGITSGKFEGGVPTKYAHLVERGTAPHIIPRGAVKLPDGTKLWAEQIQHPGSRGRFFMRKAEGVSRGPMLHVFTRVVAGELAIQSLKARPSEVDDGA